jgi:acetoacetyl-CoA synthetase
MHTQPLWQPTATQIEASNLTQFLKSVNQRWQLQLTDYEALYQWSGNLEKSFQKPKLLAF